MLADINWDWNLDGWIVLAGILCAVASALLGNFLILRKMSMLGDAISHAVLPGLAVAFMVSGSRNSITMFIGAVIVGILTALFTEWIRGVGKVDEGASMGVVFTSLFALGLVLIVQAADHVDLDPGCVLYGAIEFTPLDKVTWGSWQIPRVIISLGIVLILNTLFVTLLFKELKLSSFDPALATTTGFNARLIHYLLMILVAVTSVASFESVGNILVVAMFVVPPATAYMLTDRLSIMIFLSVIIATISAVTGHLSAIIVPGWFGFPSTTTAGMMAVMSGLFLLLAVIFSPSHGILIKYLRQRLIAWNILADDLLGLLYRIEERQSNTPTNYESLRKMLLADPLLFKFIVNSLNKQAKITLGNHGYQLTNKGKTAAQTLVRSHRLWEQYLVSHLDVQAEKLHAKAEEFEHFTSPALREQLDMATSAPTTDPHGSPIPKEPEK